MPRALPCPPALWPRFSALLDDALALPESERSAWLAAQAELEPELRQALAALIQTPQPLRFDAPPASADSAFAAGQILGPWRLCAPLGSGGMGEVWQAERADGGYQRSVALKLPHAHLLAGSVQARFARERNVLAALEHPQIARFYEAGLAANGQPWLALELVDGVPITQFCSRQKLSLPARIALLQQVAGAVQAAHARLIVHRDLKPANVLVTADGGVKLLDFGIAKLLDDDSALTQAADRAATPAYAAPEQLNGGAITVATDVFALGVMAYELLTGQRPYAAQTLAQRLATLAQEVPLASQQLAGPAQRALRGDLDSILAKALQPDPAQRYASAAAFAEDLLAQQQHRPIRARQLGRMARTARLLRRHRLPVAAAALLFASLSMGLAGTLWQAQKAQAEAARANAEANRALRTRDFLVGVFRAQSPLVAGNLPPYERRAKDLLDASAAQLNQQFAQDPETRLELLRVLAEIYRDMEDQPRAHALAKEHWQLATAQFGAASPTALAALHQRIWPLLNEGDYTAANPLLQQAQQLLRQSQQQDSALMAEWHLLSANALDGSGGAAAAAKGAHLRLALALYARHAPQSPLYIHALYALGGWHNYRLEFAQALPWLQQAAQRAAQAGEDARQAMALSSLAFAQRSLGQKTRAEHSTQQSLDLLRRSMGPQDSSYQRAVMSHAELLFLQGEPARARQMFAEVAQLQSQHPPLPLLALEYRQQAAAFYAGVGEGEAAFALLAGLPLVPHPVAGHLHLPLMLTRAEAALLAGRCAAALHSLNALGQPDYAGNDRADDWQLGLAERWGRYQQFCGKPAAATAYYRAVLQEPVGDYPITHIRAATALAGLLLVQGQADVAAPLLAQVEDWLAGYQSQWINVRLWPALWQQQALLAAAEGESARATALRIRVAQAKARYGLPEPRLVGQ